ncbi:MAG TPA: hypothetical protein VLR46_00160 [Candidatus Dormibacteraeota bacterium]|nr:hypothetical protein [Candidatus Dormibacteraeota bacterium]
MTSSADKDPAVTWAFWAACALAAIGGIVPVIFGGGINSRIAGVLVPFGVAAVGMAVNALFNHFGRLFSILVFFVGGIAMVYGVLGMLAIKLTLAVGGGCDPAPAPCPPGFERPLTGSESDSINIVVVLAVLSLFAGFVGLMMIYRRRPMTWMSSASPVANEAPVAPMTRQIAHPAAIDNSDPKPKAETEALEPKELAAPAELRELPAPLELKELPPPA